jgi:hypothetical protein
MKEIVLPNCSEFVKELIKKENKKVNRVNVSICSTDKVEKG